MDSRIFFAAAMELVITVMSCTPSISIAGMRPERMAMSSASIEVTFNEWTCSCLMAEWWVQMCTAAVATWVFLTPPSVMTAVLLELTCDDLKARLRLCRCW